MVDRRLNDLAWHESVDKRFEDSKIRFETLAEGQIDIRTELEKNTAATKAISDKLDRHVDRYDTFESKLAPVVDVVVAMEPGVKVLGQLAHAAAWVGRNVRRMVMWVAPIVAFVIAIWHFFVDKAGK